MDAFALLLLCLGLGVVLGRSGQLPRQAPQAFNAWILKVALPALVLVQIPRLQFDWALLFPILAPWFVILGAWLLFAGLGRWLGWDRALIGCLVMVCGFGNTAFLGLPMIQALQGPAALPSAVIADQMGSFLALSSVGIVVAAAYGGRSLQLADLARRVLLFPPFLALVLAFVVAALGSWPAAVESVLQRLADTLAPLALFSVGLQFRAGALRADWQASALGLSWKLLLAPLILWGVAFGTGLSGPTVTVGLLQAAMAPMITAGIIAGEHGLRPALASALVSAGILLSFLSVPLWSYALGL